MKAIANFKSEISIFKSEISNSRPRRGMTLVELLVVVTIIMLLAAATIPKLRPEMDKTRIREAARSIQLYLSSARSLAMTTGRSCGVMLEPLAAENGCSMTLTQVETPPPYGGDFTGSVATVTPLGLPSSNNGIASCKITLSTPASIPLHAGDQIQVGYQGYRMLVGAQVPAGTTPTFPASLDCSHGEMPAWLSLPLGTPSLPQPYKIWRWPTKSVSAALQLPTPACIDLTWSGIDPVVAGKSPVWQVSSTPTLIMFAADGTVDWVASGTNPMGEGVCTPIYLLVGDRAHVANSATDSNYATDVLTCNLSNIANLWVAINASTGRITVSEMANYGTSTAVLTPPNPPQNVPPYDSRYFARQSSAMGGK